MNSEHSSFFVKDGQQRAAPYFEVVRQRRNFSAIVYIAVRIHVMLDYMNLNIKILTEFVNRNI